MRRRKIAFFVSAHGFGHAARACALIEELAARSCLEFHLFSAAPRWFFDESLDLPFVIHGEDVDVGLAMRTSIEPDLGATLAALRLSLIHI